MVRLSVNLNKIALIRNGRGGNLPDVIEAARKSEEFGAQGITVHPRPDQRHITYADVRQLKSVVHTEFNVEGYPSEDFLQLMEEVKPHQVTLVPDAPEALTSNAGWDAIQHREMLQGIIARLKAQGIRTSLFMETDATQLEAAAKTGTDRIEFYTEGYARMYPSNPEAAVTPYRDAAKVAYSLGLGINAGHDLNSANLRFFAEQVPHLLEVSIGHALISDALYLGLEKTIQLYLKQLQ
jgi:pyridoxine 5-phosphate synthase